MRRICAWCNIEMDSTHLEGHFGDAITHGICKECKDKLLEAQRVELMPFLGSLNMPLVIFAAMRHAETANTREIQAS